MEFYYFLTVMMDILMLHVYDCATTVDPSLNCMMCKEEEPHCHIGNFSLSIYFHSYLNVRHLCGECRDETFGPVCCDTFNQTDNCSSDCEIRMVMSVEAYKSSKRDVKLPSRPPDFNSDNITKFAVGQDIFLRSMISNPYVVLLYKWREKFQLYIVVYDFYNIEETNDTLSLRRQAAVDRFLININLGASPAYLPRQTYVGIHNISMFDLSFSIEHDEDFTTTGCEDDQNCCEDDQNCCEDDQNCCEDDQNCCDENSQKICQNKLYDPATNCTHRYSSNIIRNAAIGGGVGGALLVAILLFVTLIIFFIYRQRGKKSTKALRSGTSNSESRETESSHKEDLCANIDFSEHLYADLDGSEQHYEKGITYASPIFATPRDNEYEFLPL